MTEDCNSNNTLLTPLLTTALYYKHDNREKLNQKDIIIQFTVACFTALCTIKSNLHLSELWFSWCRASYKRPLFNSRWLTLYYKGGPGALIQYCSVIGSKGLWFREKLKIETSQDLIVGCRLDSGTQKVISLLFWRWHGSQNSISQSSRRSVLFGVFGLVHRS